MTTSPDESPGDLDRFYDALTQRTVDELDAAPVTSPTDQVVDAKVGEALRKAEQTHSFRQTFFQVVTWSLVGILGAGAASVLMYCVSQWGHISAAVVVGFNAAVVVNTIGLAYIVANYLFPRGGAD